MRSSQEQLQAILDRTPSIIHLRDRDGRFLMANRQFEVLFQVSRETIAAKRAEELLPSEILSALDAVDLRTEEGTPTIETETVIPLKDGPHTFLSARFPVPGPVGVPIALCCIHTDITERKRLDDRLRQAQKMEAVGRLAGGIPHDFNNLLTVMMGHSDIRLGSLGEDAPALRHVRQIREAADRAAALTHKLLAFSRRQMLQPQVINLNEIIVETERMLRRLIGEDIELVTVPDADLLLVRADPGQIAQVIMNLAVNARDAMPMGGKLAIETLNIDADDKDAGPLADVPPGRYVQLSVSDTGVGMDDRTLASVFEPFFTTKESGKM